MIDARSGPSAMKADEQDKKGDKLDAAAMHAQVRRCTPGDLPCCAMHAQLHGMLTLRDILHSRKMHTAAGAGRLAVLGQGRRPPGAARSSKSRQTSRHVRAHEHASSAHFLLHALVNSRGVLTAP